MTSVSSKSGLERTLEVASIQIMSFIAEPSSLATLTLSSTQVRSFLQDTGLGTVGSTLWQLAFYNSFWKPGKREALSALRLPETFSWQTECSRRRRIGRLAVPNTGGKKPFIVRRGWAEERMLADGTYTYEYAVYKHMAPPLGDDENISEMGDTVAVITARAETCSGPYCSARGPLREVNRLCLPGARRLRYYELEVLAPGRKGYISCGAVMAEDAPLLRNSGGQPGWHLDGRVRSIGYHGDDGHLYPGRDDDFVESHGDCFGPKFSAMDEHLEWLLCFNHEIRHEVLHEMSQYTMYPRVCGMGFDLDRKCFFFTVNGVLIGETQKANLDPAACVPAVGLHSEGELVRINTGIAPFWFPIEWYSVDRVGVPRWQHAKLLPEDPISEHRSS